MCISASRVKLMQKLICVLDQRTARNEILFDQVRKTFGRVAARTTSLECNNMTLRGQPARFNYSESKCSFYNVQRCVSIGSLALLHISTRHQSSKRDKHKNSRTADEDDEENLEDDDDDEDDEQDLSSIVFADDATFPDSYKEVKIVLKSTRADGIMAAGLKMARNKVDDLFLESKLRLNGERLTKKSQQMNVGDCVDLIASTEGDTVSVKRVRVVKVADRKTSKDKLTIFLRAWRSPVPLSSSSQKRSVSRATTSQGSNL